MIRDLGSWRASGCKHNGAFDDPGEFTWFHGAASYYPVTHASVTFANYSRTVVKVLVIHQVIERSEISTPVLFRTEDLSQGTSLLPKACVG